MIAHQSAGCSTPCASMMWPCGVCIQLLAAMIQKVENSVPVATIKVAKKCRRSLTFFQPNNITPRKPASRKNAVNTS